MKGAFMKSAIIFIFCLSAFLVWSCSLFAETLSGGFEALFEGRKNRYHIGSIYYRGHRYSGNEMPFSLYGNINLEDLPSKVSFHTYFRYRDDFGYRGEEGDNGQVDVLLGYLEIPRIGERLSLKLGRQFISKAGYMFLADAVNGDLELADQLTFTFFYGKPRDLETFAEWYNQKENIDEKIWGAGLKFRLPYEISGELGYMERDLDYPKEHSELIHLSWQKPLSWPLGLIDSFLLYQEMVYNNTVQGFEDIVFGGYVFVTPELSLNLEGSYYNPRLWERDDYRRDLFDYNTLEDFIFGLFSASEMWQYKIGMNYKFGPRFSLYADYAYQTYDTYPTHRAKGYWFESGFTRLLDAKGLNALNFSMFYMDGYGGSALGPRVNYRCSITEKLNFEAWFNMVHYDKVTGQRDQAFNVRAMLSYLLMKDFKLQGFFETNSNDFYHDDIRGGLMAYYTFDTKF